MAEINKIQRSCPESKLWGGRFSESVDEAMQKFNDSYPIDKRMWYVDIRGSKAYAAALHKANLIDSEEEALMQSGLSDIELEWAEGKFESKNNDEDIHTAVERRLKEIIGPTIGGKLHTGRSRNDQVATDMRLWLKNGISSICRLLRDMVAVFYERAEKEIDILMPGYTHLQKAQPIRWSHWLLSYAWFLKQDCERFENLLTRVDVCPLGSGALAGNPFNIDREAISKDLGFSSLSPNSMMAVSDRDFVSEFLFVASLTCIHLSKWAEDLIIYSSKEFGFVTLADKFSTGSSLMPQKKNPDSLELIRGKAGRLSGHCVGFMMVLKGLPSTYNKDLQEDKEAMFDTFDTLCGVLAIASGTLNTLMVNEKACFNALAPEMLATDIAYYLVKKGVPFRNAHCTAGKVVSKSEEKQVPVTQLTLEDLKDVTNLFEEDIKDLWNYENSVEQYQAVGGTSRRSVLEQISKLKSWNNGNN